ncbi:putative signal peptide protein [Puccinia sorghi]|uniref:Putative signal peptide protein n=1 Tax=Puccinia sorghi TaxID=27349 RepID=A0A0L6UBI2_9BASI|nr:putative signal peptide protein [Puccinia sorghi]
MGMDVPTFDVLLVLFSNLWDMQTLNWSDINPHDAPQPGCAFSKYSE